MKFDIISIFPEVITPYANASILGRAQKDELININAHDLRDYTTDKHRTVDDTPYGGGPGMVMKVGPIDRAVREVKNGANGANRASGEKSRVILTSASGKRFMQKDAERLAEYDQLIFICGRYEGVDHRVEKHIADEALSIGDYVLTGGELPAIVMTDAIARLVPGVLGSAESLEEESHSEAGLLEYPQYTKPEVYEYQQNVGATPGGRPAKREKKLRVPKVLLSGNHAEIEKWQKEQSRKPGK